MSLPRHVLIIMDGNGRWAERAGLARNVGHRRGVQVLKQVIEAVMERGISVLTVFAFSSENWSRPPEEVGGLLNLFADLRSELEELAAAGVQLRFIGERKAFPWMLQRLMNEMEEHTRDHTGLRLVIAVGYGGRWDIVQASRTLASQVAAGTLPAAELDEHCFTQALSLGALPDPDLLIRSGGEHRISNCLIWHLAYTELYFTDVLWPDFSKADLDTALQWYAERQRRFGGASAQLRQERA